MGVDSWGLMFDVDGVVDGCLKVSFRWVELSCRFSPLAALSGDNNNNKDTPLRSLRLIPFSFQHRCRSRPSICTLLLDYGYSTP